jgi:hypothetical protein
MTDAKEQITKAAEHLKQQRDELWVKLHLAKAEAKDEWTRLEKQWEEMRPIRGGAPGSRQDGGIRRHGAESGRGGIEEGL